MEDKIYNGHPESSDDDDPATDLPVIEATLSASNLNNTGAIP